MHILWKSARAVRAILLGMAMFAAAPADALADARPYQMPGAIERSLAAPSGETYRLFIYAPDTPPPAGGYPLLYVLDGEDNFPIAVAIARRLARAGQRSQVEAGIIVGIDSGGPTRRARDYTPSLPEPVIQPGQPGYGLPTGGADAFLAFLEHQVHEEILRAYPIDHQRTAIAGHSFGGMFVMHTLLARPMLFQTYVAASPSLWLANGQFMKRVETRSITGLGRPDAKIMLTVGERENTAQIEQFSKVLADKGIMVQHRILAGESHGSSMPPTLSDAVRLAFRRPNAG